MSQQFSRRDWLKSGALLLGGLTTLPASMHASNNLSQKSFGLNAGLKVKLNANENPYGPSDLVKQTIIDNLSGGNRYPREMLDNFRKKLAQKEGVSEDHILIGAGSTELLILSGLAYGLEKGNILTSELTYDTILGHAKKFNANIVQVPLKADFSYDLEGISKKLSKQTNLVYICNPNNPTGTKVDAEALRAFTREVSKSAPVFVDEAYNEFLDDPDQESMIDLVREGKQVIVCRTFSKIHGMAGIRTGYMVAHPKVLAPVLQYHQRVPNISNLAVAAASASLDDKSFHQYSKQKNDEVKQHLYQYFDSVKQEYIPSYTSFTLFPIEMETEKFQQEMMAKGVGIRVWKHDNRNWCRVSMGTKEEIDYFIDNLKTVI